MTKTAELWKKEAQAEKERLARRVEGGPAAAGPAPPAQGGPHADAEHGPGQTMPDATFSVLVQTLATQAALFLSDERDPETGESLRQLDLAKHHVDLLGVLEEKTKGNLTPEEGKLLDDVLYELRLSFLEIQKGGPPQSA